MRLKQKFNMLIFLTALVSAGIAYVVSVWALETQISSSINGQIDAISSSIEHDVKVFDSILILIEEQWEQELYQALPLIAKDLANHDVSTNSSILSQRLKTLKQAYRLSDLHLVNDNLIVYASTFEDEIGLDISSFSDEYTQLVQNAFENNMFKSHRVSLSTLTGDLKKYAYYSLRRR